jgi:hypothetical protein
MDVGFDLLGPLGVRPSMAVSSKGDDERAEEEASRYVERVNECSSAAVANRDSIRSPLCESISSCTPTVQPDKYVGIEYAMAAVMLVAVVRSESETGGHAVFDRREYKSLGASKRPKVPGISSTA